MEQLTRKERAGAIKQLHNSTLEFWKASPAVRADREVATLAVQINGYWLRHVSDELKECPIITKLAITEHPWTLEDVHPRFKDDPEFVLLAVQRELELEQISKAEGKIWGMEPYECLENASKKIREIIGDRDPVKALSSHILAQKLSTQLKPKQTQQMARKI